MTTGVGQATPPIAAVLADVDGTLVPKADAPPRGMRMLVEPLGMKVPVAA